MSAIQLRYLKQMKRLKYKITLARILLFAGFITLWEVSAYAGWIDDFIFSSPSRIIKTLFAMISDGSIFYHTAVTVAETGISFALIVLLGVGTAILLWSSKTISAVLEPYLVLLNSLPKSALAPMIIVWLGNNAKAIIVTAISVGVFGTILNIYTSFAETDSDKILLIQTLSVCWREAFEQHPPVDEPEPPLGSKGIQRLLGNLRIRSESPGSQAWHGC